MKYPHHPIPNLRKAFSIIELLVAISILSLMMTLAARIFFDAQKGVQRGIQTSQIIAESRSISQPLSRDVSEMNVFSSKYESNNPGFLVIAQRSFQDVKFPAPDNITDDTSEWSDDRDGDGNPGEYAGVALPNNYFDDLMRSDQIGFFRDATKLESLTPGEDSRYDSDAKARHAFIWYGHTSPIVGATSLDPGNPDYDLASQLVLGRQALLLVEFDAATTHPNGTDGDASPGPTPGVNNRVADPSAVSVRESTYEGEYDVLDLTRFTRGGFAYPLYDDLGVDPAGVNPRALFRTPTYVTAAGGNQSYFGGSFAVGPSPPAPGLTNTEYANRALEWMYLVAGQRLQAQASLETDFSGGIYTADELATLHASFAPHVADFAIEFAADWTDDLDMTTGIPVAGQDGQPDYEPDRDGFGNIRWYTLLRPNPDNDNNGVGDIRPAEPVTYDARLPAFYPARFDGNVGADLGGNPFIQFDSFVWSHTGDVLEGSGAVPAPPDVVEGAGKYWPYLIRFRYRLMDGRGEFRTIETNPDGDGNGTPDDPIDYSVVGRWFEQIVPVPRPEGLY